MSAEIITLPSGRQAFKPRADNVLTPAGVEIGRAYVPPAPRELGVYGERVQTALLSPAYCATRGHMADREDAKTQHVRGLHDSAMRALRPIRRPSVLPNVIDLDSSLLARLERALRAVGRVLRGITNWGR